MKRIFIPLLFCILLPLSVLANDPYYHQVKAVSGDHIFKLLDRYSLANHRCNYEQFYKLNDLNKNSKLFADKLYYLPVLIYTYNKKSIRSTLGIDSWDQAIRIKQYNENLLSNDLRQSTIIGSNILWVPHHELYCNAEVMTENEKLVVEEPNETTTNIEKGKSGNRNFPIFGKKYAHVPLVDTSLRGKIFYIVAGHGGPDSGAVGKANGKQICEDEYAYDVALRLCRNLIARGAVAYMITRDPNDGIRDGEYLAGDYDEYCWGNFKIPRSQKRRLFQRSDAINERFEVHKKQDVGEQIMVSIHIDSRSKSSRTDVFFYFYPGSNKGKKLADTLQQTMKAKYKKYNPSRTYSGTVTARDLHMLRETKSTGAYIELGNIRNKSDQRRFLLTSNRQALADWLFDGLVAYVRK